MKRRSFIGVVSSFFLLRKPIKLDEFEIIEKSIFIQPQSERGWYKFIFVYEDGKKFSNDMAFPVSGATEECVQETIKHMKRYSKKFYIYRIFDERGNLLNCIGSETPGYVDNFHRSA